MSSATQRGVSETSAADAREAPLVEAVGLSVGHQGVAVGSPVSFALGRGELVCLLGPNGAGKTTLLRTLSGLHPPVGGTIELCGDDLFSSSVRQRARRIAVVLTGRPATGMLTVAATVGLGRHPHTSWSGRFSDDDRRAVEQALRAFRLESFADRPLEELSDGEAQRTLIARAVAQEPELLLLDEPTAFLDLERRSQLFDALARLTRERGLTVLLSTHDLELAMARADRVLLMMSDRWVDGAPEDVALEGALEQLLGEGDLRYDDSEGRFRRRLSTSASALVVSSDPRRALWGRRMMERVGFDVVDASSPEDIDAVLRDGGSDWRLEQGGTSESASTLGEVAEAVRRFARR